MISFIFRAAYHLVLKMCKLLMTAVGHAQVQLVVEACHAEAGQSATPVSTTVHNHAVVLQQALHHIPNQTADCLTRNAAAKLGQHLVSQVD